MYSQLTLAQVPSPQHTFISARNLSRMFTAKTNVSVANPKKLVRLQRSSTLAFLCLGHRLFSFYDEKQSQNYSVAAQMASTTCSPSHLLLRVKRGNFYFPLKTNPLGSGGSGHSPGPGAAVSLAPYPAQPHLHAAILRQEFPSAWRHSDCQPQETRGDHTLLPLLSSPPPRHCLSNTGSAFKTNKQTDFRDFCLLNTKAL